MSEEIICTACGRPNLPEAKLCWYCQTVLQDGNGEPDATEEAGYESEVAVDAEAESQNSESADPVEDIPDWLKRIRELKKEDQPDEEEEDQWRQQILFNSKDNASQDQKEEKPGLRKPKKTSPPKTIPQASKQNPSAAQSKIEPLIEPILDFEANGEEINALPKDEEDLPDGFTPLDTKKG